MTPAKKGRPGGVERIVGWLSHAEDVVYIGVGAVLALAALGLLAAALQNLAGGLRGDLRGAVLQMLDTLLLTLMLVEVMHTVGISLREHEFVTEPFLIVGLIAAVRRVLVITAEQQPASARPDEFQMMMTELALLTVLITALVFAIFLMRRRSVGGRDVSKPGHERVTATDLHQSMDEEPEPVGEHVQPGPEPGTYTLVTPDGRRRVLVPKDGA